MSTEFYDVGDGVWSTDPTYDFEGAMGIGIVLAFGAAIAVANEVFDPFGQDEPARAAQASPVPSSASWQGSCRVRSGPGIEFSVIGSTRPAKVYDVRESRGRWKRIGPRGWIGCR
jgi:hypothetical protein